jgi:hypothetical protein
MIVGVLALAAAGAGLMLLNRTQSSSDASPGTTSAAPAHAPPRTTQARPATPLRPAPSRTPAAAPSDGLPPAIAAALASNHVVVVALYDPKAKIDDTARREAKAGAQRAGSSFVPINVRTSGIDVLNAMYGASQDPAVLVLRPPGELVIRIDGFADRDTVAQAAVDAAS